MKVQRANTIIEVEAYGTYYEEFTDHYTYALDEEPKLGWSDEDYDNYYAEAKRLIIEDILKTHSSTYYYDYKMFTVYNIDGKTCRCEI